MTKFTVNDRPVQYKMDPQTPLLWALRDASNLTGTKYGCGTGDCGACMVEIDGESIRSCLVTIAEAEGRFVTTIEKVAHGGHFIARHLGAVIFVRHAIPGEEVVAEITDVTSKFARGNAIEIIKALGVTEIELLTNNPEKLTAFAGTGISYKGRSLQVKANEFNKEYLRTKRDLLSHSLGEI